ncbi:DUF2147 domain-containing protein [Mucilaginibacter ginkgonis]|uniref:DUF2147 domain-containing protein n=1 Tax=Mucilaginibacter ginkgonis TaxID=2682091 RepID=A0A6I4HYF8_9SPHI|nr:DUF2147 domain-containing protein [Mucilaginibacter ginkgonis]QQL50353.1 DUF2147 domain-containing protein [Mucilaginibacter ginkgonis]
MVNKLTLGVLIMMVAFIGTSNRANAQSGSDQVIGNWMSAEKNLIVQVYREGDDFKAKVIWFDDSDDPSKPMESRIDDSNPDKSLRTRKIIGMQVLRNLAYSPSTHSWENGMIYDAKSGREWNAAASIDKAGMLRVTGYWHFKFIGKTMKFSRVTPSEIMMVSR